jgi:yecA family protein
MPVEPRGPLHADELERLQARLVEAMAEAACMPLDVAHGFLTATGGASVDQGAESALLDRVLGGLAADAELRVLLSRFRAQLVDDLERAEYGPLILELPRDGDDPLPLPYGWCQGYVDGLEYLGDALRDRLMADEEAGILLAPILSFLMYDEGQLLDPPNEAAHRESAGELGDAALGLYRWRRQRAS